MVAHLLLNDLMDADRQRLVEPGDAAGDSLTMNLIYMTHDVAGAPQHGPVLECLGTGLGTAEQHHYLGPDYRDCQVH